MSQSDEAKARHLVLVLGDQLDGDAAVFDDFDRKPDAVHMMEVAEEASSITQHKIRLALFVSAVRHFGQDQVDKGVRVHYAAFEGSNNQGSFAEEIARWGHKSRPEKLIRSKPGDFRVLSSSAAGWSGPAKQFSTHLIAHMLMDAFASSALLSIRCLSAAGTRM